MQIHVHTDSNIDGRTRVTSYVEREVTAALSRFSDLVQRIEVHLSDESAGKAVGAPIRCMVEARPAGQMPVTVTHHGHSPDEALDGALHKLTRLLESDTGRLEDRDGRASIRGHAQQ